MHFRRLALSLSLLLFLSACERYKNGGLYPAPIGELPPVTETGAGTFGCRINGEVFVPVSHMASSAQPLRFSSDVIDDTVVLSVHAVDFLSEITSGPVGILFKGASLKAGSVLPFAAPQAVGVSARGGPVRDSFNSLWQTSAGTSGEMRITRVSYEADSTTVRGLSGTFWFDAADTAGTVYRIRDGRFDVQR